MTLIEALLTEIERHLEATGQTATEFGRAAVGDPSFVFRLRKGSGCRTDTVERVRSYITTYVQQAA